MFCISLIGKCKCGGKKQLYLIKECSWHSENQRSGYFLSS